MTSLNKKFDANYIVINPIIKLYLKNSDEAINKIKDKIEGNIRLNQIEKDF